MVDYEYGVDVDPYEGVPVLEITHEELEKQAVRTRNKWQDNLRTGSGAEGTHGGPYVNTGEAINDLTYKFTGDLEVVVGGDVIQLAIAEFGRAPGTPPPREPIATWAREKGIQPEEGTFDDMVDAIRFAIADNGLEPFAPATAAANSQKGELEKRIRVRLDEELASQASDG